MPSWEHKQSTSKMSSQLVCMVVYLVTVVGQAIFTETETCAILGQFPDPLQQQENYCAWNVSISLVCQTRAQSCVSSLNCTPFLPLIY